jgi:hypothetical protein
MNAREADSALTVAPELPSEGLNYLKLENLLFSGVKYDLAVTNRSVAIDNVRGAAVGARIKLKFKVGDGFDIYVDGAKANAVREGEYLTATVPFGKLTAEAKKR